MEDLVSKLLPTSFCLNPSNDGGLMVFCLNPVSDSEPIKKLILAKIVQAFGRSFSIEGISVAFTYWPYSVYRA